jgi:hypothetical protein
MYMREVRQRNLTWAVSEARSVVVRVHSPRGGSKGQVRGSRPKAERQREAMTRDGSQVRYISEGRGVPRDESTV